MSLATRDAGSQVWMNFAAVRIYDAVNVGRETPVVRRLITVEK